MTAFPTDPPLSLGLKITTKYAKRQLQYGEAYSTRERDGIHNVRRAWNLVWNEISDSEAEALKALFDAAAGVDTFDWTPPDGGSEIKVSVDSLDRVYNGWQNNTVTAVATEEFDP